MATPEQTAIIPVLNRLFNTDLDPFASNHTIATKKVIEIFVSHFNRLPRPHLTLCFFAANHWHFCFRILTLHQADMVLFMINPGGRYCHIEHPPSVALFHEPLHRKAHVSAILLLKAFASESMDRARPWSWSTDYPPMARCVAAWMRAYDIADELKAVGVTSREDMKIVNEEWMVFYTTLVQKLEVDDDTTRDILENERKRIQGSEGEYGPDVFVNDGIPGAIIKRSLAFEEEDTPVTIINDMPHDLLEMGRRRSQASEIEDSPKTVLYDL